MGFLDDMSAQINRGVGAAEKKAKIIKLKGDISSLDRDKRNKYAVLGEAFYTNETNQQLREVYNTEIAAIDDINAKIAELSTEISKLEAPIASSIPVAAGGLRCPACGAPYNLGDAFCMQCGNKIEPAEAQAVSDVPLAAEPAVKTCPQCGVNIKEADVFCGACGAPLA